MNVMFLIYHLMFIFILFLEVDCFGEINRVMLIICFEVEVGRVRISIYGGLRIYGL